MRVTDHKAYRLLAVQSAHIDSETSGTVEAEVLPLIDGRPIFLDLSQVRYVDSTGLGCILRIVRSSAEKGSKVVLCRPTSAVRMLLDFSQLKQFAEISDSCDTPESPSESTR